jgi:hypothetical protein
MVERTNLHIGDPAVSMKEMNQIRYGVAMWLLQENAGMSYKEARVFLSGSRNENTEQLAEALGITIGRVYNLRKSAREKLEGKSFDDIVMGYYPLMPEVSGPSKKPYF